MRILGVWSVCPCSHWLRNVYDFLHLPLIFPSLLKAPCPDGLFAVSISLCVNPEEVSQAISLLPLWQINPKQIYFLCVTLLGKTPKNARFLWITYKSGPLERMKTIWSGASYLPVTDCITWAGTYRTIVCVRKLRSKLNCPRFQFPAPGFNFWEIRPPNIFETSIFLLFIKKLSSKHIWKKQFFLLLIKRPPNIFETSIFFCFW